MLQYNTVTRAIIANSKAEGTRVINCIEGTERDPVTYGQSIIDTIGVLLTENDVSGMNQKAGVYVARACRWIASSGLDTGKHSQILSFVVATVCNTAQSRISFSDMHYAAGGKGDNTAPIGGISRAKLGAIIGFGSRNMGTLSAQVSGFAGARGILTGLGITAKPDNNGFSVTATGRAHPFILAYALTLNGLSDRTVIDLMEA